MIKLRENRLILIKIMIDESNTETLSKEIEEEVLKKVDQLCKDVFHRMIYGPSQEEEQMIKDTWLNNNDNNG